MPPGTAHPAPVLGYGHQNTASGKFSRWTERLHPHHDSTDTPAPFRDAMGCHGMPWDVRQPGAATGLALPRCRSQHARHRHLSGRLERESRESCCSKHASSVGKQMTSASRELLKPSSTHANVEGGRKRRKLKREKQRHTHARPQSTPR